MPEFPDVEEFRRLVEARALRRPIADVQVRSRLGLAGAAPDALRRRLAGRSLAHASRHGKHLIAELVDGDALGLHFGMTGWLAADADPLPRATRVVLSFADGGTLAFVDQRQLGRIALAQDPAAYIAEHGLGPDALAISATAFAAAIGGRRGAIKAVLMDQALVAGVGNIYADEILFQAGIPPLAVPARLGADDLRRLHHCLRRVLRTEVAHRAAPASGATAPRAAEVAHRAAPASGATAPRAAEVAHRAAPASGATAPRAAEVAHRAAPASGATAPRAAEKMRHADPRRLPDDWLLPRRGPGGECPRCGGAIAEQTVAGRTAYYCPRCQPARSRSRTPPRPVHRAPPGR